MSHALSTEIIKPTKEIPQPMNDISLLIPLAETEIPNKIMAMPTKILLIAFITNPPKILMYIVVLTYKYDFFAFGCKI